MSRKPQRKRGHAGTWLASAAAAGLFLAAVTTGHGHHHRGLTGILDSLHAAPASSGGTGGNKALANHLAARLYGWTGTQRGCLDNLWARESGFSNTADTRQTGAGGDGPRSPMFAYGIAQARGHGPDTGGITAPYPAPFQAANPPSMGGTSDARTQILWGLRYIKVTPGYGTPCAAWDHEVSDGWY